MLNTYFTEPGTINVFAANDGILINDICPDYDVKGL